MEHTVFLYTCLFFPAPLANNPFRAPHFFSVSVLFLKRLPAEPSRIPRGRICFSISRVDVIKLVLGLISTPLVLLGIVENLWRLLVLTTASSIVGLTVTAYLKQKKAHIYKEYSEFNYYKKKGRSS